MLALFYVTSYNLCVQVFYLHVERVNVHCVFMISVTMRGVADFIASSDMKV